MPARVAYVSESWDAASGVRSPQKEGDTMTINFQKYRNEHQVGVPGLFLAVRFSEAPAPPSGLWRAAGRFCLRLGRRLTGLGPRLGRAEERIHDSMVFRVG